MSFFGMKKKDVPQQSTKASGSGATSTVSVIAAGRAPVSVEGEEGWTVEDYLTEADIDANQVTIDGASASLSDEVPLNAKRIVAVPNVKGGC